MPRLIRPAGHGERCMERVISPRRSSASERERCTVTEELHLQSHRVLSLSEECPFQLVLTPVIHSRPAFSLRTPRRQQPGDHVAPRFRFCSGPPSTSSTPAPLPDGQRISLPGDTMPRTRGSLQRPRRCFWSGHSSQWPHLRMRLFLKPMQLLQQFFHYYDRHRLSIYSINRSSPASSQTHGHSVDHVAPAALLSLILPGTLFLFSCQLWAPQAGALHYYTPYGVCTCIRTTAVFLTALKTRPE
ncbi:hypothetical protein M432DRAFT_201496 [Thermoascus aurantiacus ATCC 26904]